MSIYGTATTEFGRIELSVEDMDIASSSNCSQEYKSCKHSADELKGQPHQRPRPQAKLQLFEHIVTNRDMTAAKNRKKTKYINGKNEDDGKDESAVPTLLKDTAAMSMETQITCFLQKLKCFQDRLHKDNPVKAKANRRFIIGLREVRQRIECGSVKLVFLATDIDTESNKDLEKIRLFDESRAVPILYALPKRRMGKILRIHPFCSAVGILNYDGAKVCLRIS
ncbi:hypothetical protein AB6A40_007877 [Gnathostoma spinigerum]|uniref:Ribosomal protein eL8/eL30/eS12/Gadd45 domain-containing protein n=1 Tax=Gnathostoma spinigerum TaxID=75299 RepID=A0ABD6EMS5_9BILA